MPDITEMERALRYFSGEQPDPDAIFDQMRVDFQGLFLRDEVGKKCLGDMMRLSGLFEVNCFGNAFSQYKEGLRHFGLLVWHIMGFNGAKGLHDASLIMARTNQLRAQEDDNG